MKNKISSYLSLVAAVGIMFTATVAVAQSTATDPQIAKTYDETVTQVVHASYLLSLPKDYDKDTSKKWPLVIFLHGSGESGNDLNLVKKHGLPKLIAQGKEFPFIVVSPQAPSAREGWNIDVLNRLLDDVIAHNNVDKDRVYLTGLSMGGFGTWAWATANPQRFAAVAPVCGGGIAHYAGYSMKNLPVWAFHGGKDATVSIQETFNMVNALKRAGAKEVNLTVFPEDGHNSWDDAYNTEALYTWLLAHTRAAKAP